MRVTFLSTSPDSRGAMWPVRLFYTNAGWSSASFVVPDEVATGPADVDVVRSDGSVARSRVLIADLAPALPTRPQDGRSVAEAVVDQLNKPGKPAHSSQKHGGALNPQCATRRQSGCHERSRRRCGSWARGSGTRGWMRSFTCFRGRLGVAGRVVECFFNSREPIR